MRARVGDGDLFATPAVGDDAWSVARWVLLATGRGGERHVRGIPTWDPGQGSIGPGDLIPSRVLDGMRRKLALLPEREPAGGPAGVLSPAEAKAATPRKKGALSGPPLDAAAAAVLSEYPDWTRAQVARHLKVDKRRISDCARLPDSKLVKVEKRIATEREERRKRLADFERRDGLTGTDE